MQDPEATRPSMPDYGIADATEGAGLLPWSWATERLSRSHDYWVTTVNPDGRPQTSAVWGVWMRDSLWFSCGPRSRKSINLTADARLSVAADDPHQQVVLEGVAVLITDPALVEEFSRSSNGKYQTDYSLDFSLANRTYRVDPLIVVGIDDADFAGTPTRWRLTEQRPEP